MTVTNSKTGCYATASVEVTTFGGNLQLTPSATVVCAGEPVVLNANIYGFNNENVVYEWSTEETASTITVFPTDTTTYVVTAVAGNCTMVDSITIFAATIDTVKVQLASVESICQGGQIKAVATASPAVADYFVWYLNGQQLAGENLDTLVLNMNESGNYYLASKAIVNGCDNAPLSEPVYFTVDSMPVVTITGNHYYTTGATVATLTASNDYGFTSFEWSNGESGQEIEVNEYGVYTVTATTANGCVAISEPFTVSSVEDLQVNIEGAHAACQNDHVTLSAIVDYDLEGHTYQWYVDNQIIDNATEAHYTFDVNALYESTGSLSHEFTVEIMRANCTTPVVSPVHSFLINPVPMAAVVAPEKVCAGSDVTLEAVVYQLGEDNQYQYVWYQDNEESVYAGPVSYVNTLVVPAADVTDHSYAVKVIFQDTACSSSVSNFVEVELYTQPSEISMRLIPTDICTTNQAELTIIDENDEATYGPVVYTWFMNGVEVAGVNGDVYVADFDHNGEYSFWAAASYAEYPCALVYTDTVVENVNMNPTVQITGDPIICHTNIVELFANLNDEVEDMNYNYEWRLYNYTLGNEFDVNFFGTHFTYDDPAFLENFIITANAGENTNHFISSPLEAREYPYIFTVVVTTPEGCRVVSDPYYVYVGESPEVVVTVDYDAVCAGGEVTAVAHLGDYNMPGLTYQWYNGEEPIDYGTEPVLHINIQETAELWVKVTQNATGCTAESEPVTVTVVNPQSLNSILVVNNGNVANNICEGAQLFLSAQFKDEETGEYYIDSTLTYVWELNGMQLSTVHGPQFSAQAYIYDNDPVDYIYTAYVVYDIPGCVSVPVASDTIHVRRNPIVTIDGNPNVCYYGPNVENVTLTAWVDGDVDHDATYTWFESGQSRPNPLGFDNKYRESWVPTYENPYIFTVEVTNGDGCTTISEPFYVNVYDKPNVNITSNISEICENGEITLRASLDNNNEPMMVFQWYKDEVNNTHILDGYVHEEETFQPEVGETDYIVKVTHLMDYVKQYCVAYDTFTVNVNAIPVVTAVNDLDGVTSICEGRTITMTATTTGGVAGGETYTWYRNGEVVENVTSNVFVDSPVTFDNEPVVYTYKVVVEQAASACQSNEFVFDPITVNPNPTTVLATDPIVCAEEGDNIELVAVVTPDPATGVTYNWYDEELGLIGTTTHNDTAFNRPYRSYPYNFRVELQNDYGCVSTGTATVYVNDNIVVNITSDTNVCSGGEITLTAALDDWNADQLRFQWYDEGEPIPGATQLNYTFVPTQGTHTYTLTVKQMTSGCEATTDPHVVHVHEIPVVETINTHELPENFQVCDGFQVELTAEVLEGSGVPGGETYTWYRNGVLIEGATAATFTEVVSAQNGEPTQYTYAVSVMQEADGCISEITYLDPITVNPNPTLLLVTDPIVCEAEEGNVQLHANVYPENEGFTYRWFENNVELEGNESTLILTKPYSVDPYNFKVEIVNDFACTASSEAIVYVNAQPVVNIIASETQICEGGEITLSAALNDWNADMLIFQWYDNGEPMDGATSLSYTFVPENGHHEYSLYVKQETSGCEATSNVIPVDVNDIPVIEEVILSQYNICNGGQVEITAVPADGLEIGTYTWYRNGILMEGATAATIYDTPGTVDNNTQQYVYTAVVTRPAAGCISLSTSSNVLTVYPNPTPVITGDQHVCETDSIFLIANVDTTGMAVGSLHYTWFESGQIRPNMYYNLGDRNFFAEPFVARTEPYIFTVQVSRDNDATGCIATSADFYVYVYPQPVVTVTASETSICENGEVTLTANLQDNNADNITYQWYVVKEQVNQIAVDYAPNGGYIYASQSVIVRENIPGATSATYTTTLNEPGVKTIGVQVLQTNSTCTSYDSIDITVNAIPVVTNITVNDLDTIAVCDGAQVTVTAETDPANAAGAVFTWYRNGVEIEGATEAIFSENVYTTDNHQTVNHYSAIVTLPASGCISEMSDDAGVVFINPAPSTVSISGVNVICESDSTTLTAYSDVDGEFTWSYNESHENSIRVPAGSYTVTLKTAGGCEMTSTPFVVEAYGTDLIVTASTTHTCAGEPVTLYVDQDGWQGNVDYQWDANANNSTANSVDVTPEETTIYNVTATVHSTNGDCSYERHIEIVVTPLPNQLTVTPSDTQICEGSQVTFTAEGAADATSYIWYANGVEIPGENEAILTVNFNQAGEYTYTAKAKNDQQCVSALASEPVTVVVNAAPTSVSISGDQLICNGGYTMLYANVVPEAAAGTTVVYTWYKDNQEMDLVSTDTIRVYEAGSYKVYVSYNGCTTESAAYQVTVQDAPQLQLLASESTICVNGNTTITAEAYGWNNGEMNYSWSHDANYHSSSYIFNPQNAGIFTFTVTASQATNGCEAVASVTINVDSVPATPIIAVNNDETSATICDGGQVVLSVTNHVGGTYTWYRNGYVIDGATMGTIYESPATVDGDLTTYTYNVEVAFEHSGCTSAKSANTIVTVIPTPEAVVEVVGSTTLCEGGSTILQANVTPAGVAYNYQWYKNNVIILDATSYQYEITDAVANLNDYNYHVVVSANAGCSVPAYAPAITVVANPEVTATISQDTSCVGGVAVLTATVDGGAPGANGLNGYTFNWYRNTPILGEIFSTTDPIGTGATYTTSANDPVGDYTYWVTVANANGCVARSNNVAYRVESDPTVTIVRVPEYAATVCENGATAIKAVVTGGNGTATYQWYKNTNLIPGATNAVLYIDNLTAGANDVYAVEVSQTGVACSGAASANLNTLVTVVEPYTVNITGFGNVCEGGTLELVANVPNRIDDDVLTYQWYKSVNGEDGIAINGATDDHYTTSAHLLGNSYDYYVEVISQISGCTTFSTSVPANVVASPTVSISGANTVCEGGTLVLNAFVNDVNVEGGDYTYTWNWIGADHGTVTTTVPTFEPEISANDAAAPYYFTVTISRGDNTGCTATSDQHEVNVLAAPTVTVTADNSYVCEGGNVTFTAHVTPVGTYNYVWTINGGAPEAVNTPTITVPAAGNTSILAQVAVSAVGASSSCSAAATLASAVHVVAAPTVSLTASQYQMCVGGVTTLTATPNVDSHIPGNFVYEWVVDGVPVSGVTEQLNQTLTAAGIHTYKVRVSMDNALGCASTDWSNVATIQVAEQPVVTLNSVDGLSICEGGTVTLNAVVNNYDNNVNGVTNSAIYGTMTYNWTKNGIGGISHTAQGSDQLVQTLNTVGNYNYQVSVDAAGYNCQPQISNVETVNVVGNPSWTDVHVYSNNGTDACLGEIVYLQASIQGGATDGEGSTSGHIQWVVSDGTNTYNVSGGLGGNSYDIPVAAGHYTYTATFVGNIGSGCQLTNTADAQVGVDVHALPTVEFTNGDGASICANDGSASVEMQLTFTGEAPFTYEVVDGNGNFVAGGTTLASTVSFFVAPATQTTYRVSLIRDLYCENTSSATATVKVNNIEFEDNLFVADCGAQDVTVNYNVISGIPTTASVVYDNGDQYPVTLGNNSATFQVPTTPGDYNAILTINDCDYNIVVRVRADEYAFGATMPIVDQRWGDVVVVNCNPATNGGLTFVGFQWYHNNVAIPGANYSNYQDKDGLNGFYSVELVAEDANGNRFTFMTCDKPFYGTSNVKVYPVPANVRQEITIELDLTSEELDGAVLDIFSVTGAHINHVTNLQPITKIEGFKAQGTYFGRILTGTNEIKTVKFVIVK